MLKHLLSILVILLLISCKGQDSDTHNTSKMNQLHKSSSPYLLQHADNPVYWQEWSPEVLQRATDENKPLIISIGYAACHWCHVMEHESFSDQEVADYMNENFICIKVDREERPDVDRIYMDAVQIITGQGGWPLNAFAMPDGKPFFAGTYFNKARWMEVMEKIVNLYHNDHKKVVDYAAQLTEGINSNSLAKSLDIENKSITKEDYLSLFDNWKSQLDFQYGGFNRAPKFPLPVAWEFLLQYNYFSGDEESLKIVEKTLDEMAKGGIYDHIGGGFARYSVDAYWKVPHFEKMLYDNSQLVSLYSHAYQITKKERYKEIVEQTLDFVERELMSKEGGFYSSLNADSEGEEGAFYVFTKEDFDTAVDENIRELVQDYYQISEKGNWEHSKNILHTKYSKQEFADKNKMDLQRFNIQLQQADSQLMKYRDKRERPSTDDKILTSWNSLMLTAYIDAHRAFGKEKYLKVAIRNAEFMHDNIIKEDGSLYRNHMNGKSSIYAFHDDYASLAQAYMDLYSVTFNKKWLEISKSLVDYCIVHFMDTETGMFFYTSDMSENLIARKHEITDNVIPSSNSIMANTLLYLSHYYDKQEYKDIVSRMFMQVADNVAESGPWYANWAILMGLMANDIYEVAIVGDDALSKNADIQKHYLPNTMFLGGLEENLPLLMNKTVLGKTMIYVCKNKTCKLPVEKIEEALEQIN